MTKTATASVLSLMITPLIAQHAIPVKPSRPAPVEISRAAGLQPDGPSDLVGGGARYMVRFANDGIEFLPALGRAAPETKHLDLRAIAVHRGKTTVLAGPFEAEPEQHHDRCSYRHAPSIEERYDVGVDGVEISWRFDRRPVGHGDLVVRYAIGGNLPAPTTAHDGGLTFVDGDLGGVSIGGVTGIDALGKTVRGTLAFANGQLTMSLPSTFVDEASYPIVLDPLVGPLSGPIATSWPDSDPDIAYDASNDRYLVTWLREYSATSRLPMALLLDSSAQVATSQRFLSTVGTCERPRVANFPEGDRFGVVFRETDGLFDGIQFKCVDAGSFSITHQTVIASSTGVSLYHDPVIGGAAAAPFGGQRAFVVAYEDDIHDEIRLREVYFTASDTLVAPSPQTVFANTGGVFNNTYTQPAISRQSRLNSRFVIAARRFSGVGPSQSISLRAFSTALGFSATTSLDTTQTDDLWRPAVDGQDGSYVVAWEREGSSGLTGIRRRRALFDGSTWTYGPVQTQGGVGFFDHSAPSVAWTPTRTWIGYRNYSGIGPAISLRVTGIDTATGTSCNDDFAYPITTSEARIVATTQLSGGMVGGEQGMAVFAAGLRLYAQPLINYGSSGSFTDLGGSCGNGGSQNFGHSPGIGSSAIVCNLSGLPPTAVLSVFNFAAAGATPLPCGPCVWEPFLVTVPEVPTGSVASTYFPIPCLPALVGTNYVLQWTTFDPTATACSLFPGLALSERQRMTIGS